LTLITMRNVPRRSRVRNVAADPRFRRTRLHVRPAAGRRAALELHHAARERPGSEDPHEEAGPANSSEPHPRPDADHSRAARQAAPGGQVGREDGRPREIAPRTAGARHDGGDRPGRARAEFLGKECHRLAGAPGRHEPREDDAAPVHNSLGMSIECHAGRRERPIGASSRPLRVPRHQPVVVGRPGPQARKPE
jgi:hypothetical protein